jgi:hypothetical protein
MLNEMKAERVPLQIGWAVPASGATRTRWEYLSLQADAEAVTAIEGGEAQLAPRTPLAGALEAIGADDWELVSVTPHPSGGFLYLFKRPVLKV